MANQIAGIDHAIVGVRDLERAKASFERLGFRLTPRGRHVGWGTANYCVMFEGDYIELLGIVDPKQFTNDLDRFLERDEGMLSLALRSLDPAATRAAWVNARLEPAEVEDLSRVLDSDGALNFRNVMLRPDALFGLRLFACAPLTPELMRRREWLEHPNGVVGISSITVVTEHPGSFVEPMSRVFGETKLTETDDTLAVHTGQGVLLFATPDDVDMLHPQLKAAVHADQPRLAVLTLRTRDLEHTATWLEHAAIAFQREASGAIGIGADHAHGVMLEFVH